MAHVQALVVYPIKGCAGLTLSRAEITDRGLAGDREFMVVRAEDGRFRSQRELPVLAAVQPEVLDGGIRLVLRAPGMDELKTEVVPDGPRRSVSVWAYTGDGVDQGDEAAEWFSEVLGESCRLVRVPPDHPRTSGGWVPGRVGFADGYALLVASQASLDTLNERILESGGEPVPMSRFRPNLVVAGWDEPHAEDRARRVTIAPSGVEIAGIKRCKRCSVPLVDQETGRRTGPEPIRTLATYRRHPDDGQVMFGMNFTVLRPGPVAVGDELTVTEWADPEE